MEKGSSGLKMKVSTKPRAVRKLSGSHAVEVPLRQKKRVPSGNKTNSTRVNGVNAAAQSRERRLTWVQTSLQPLSIKKNLKLSAVTFATNGKWVSRSLRSLLVAFFSGMFISALLRVVARHRKWMMLETVEKPRAAGKIKAAWRVYRQRWRMRWEAAVKVLVPFFRRKLRRIRAVRAKAVLLLQRVFRSQRDRYFIHWLYNQMKYNRALDVIRQGLKLRMAKRHVGFLALQRDERAVCERRCAIATLSLLRQERAELLQILHWMNTEAQSTLTPLVTKAMLVNEINCCTGCRLYSPHCSLLPVNGANTVQKPRVETLLNMQGTASEGNLLELTSDDASSVVIDKSDTGNVSSVALFVMDGSTQSWISILHKEEDARRFVEELFERKLPSYPILREHPKERCLSAKLEGKTHDIFIPVMSNSTKSEVQGSLKSSIRSVTGDVFPKINADVNSKVVSLQGESSLDAPKVSLKRVMNAFIDLLIRTEAIERKALMSDLQNRHRELVQQMDWFSTTVQATHASLPLYASLLPSMREKWAVRRAVQLFRQEHEERSKIIEEYLATPLHFLDRPVFNSAAEERRRRLLERVQEKKEAAAEVASMPEDVQWNISHLPALALFPQESRVNCEELLDKKPLKQLSSPPPLPPSPPPRKAHNPLPKCSSSLGTATGRFQRRHHRQRSLGGVASLVEPPLFLHALATEFGNGRNEGNSLALVPGLASASRSIHVQDATLPKPVGNLSLRDEGFSGFLPSIMTMDKNNNSQLRSSTVEVPSTSVNIYSHLSFQHTDGNSVGLPVVKRAIIDELDVNNFPVDIPERSVSFVNGPRVPAHPLPTPPYHRRYDACDKTNLQKNYFQGSQSYTSGMTRGLPIPMLRNSLSPDCYTTPSPSCSVRISKPELIAHKETGADYVRSQPRCLLPSVSVAEFIGTDGPSKPVLLPTISERQCDSSNK